MKLSRRSTISAGCSMMAMRRWPVAASSSIAMRPAAAKSRSTQCSPCGSSGTPIITTGTGSAAATGTRSSWVCTFITMIASHNDRPATRWSPAAPSLAASNSTS